MQKTVILSRKKYFRRSFQTRNGRTVYLAVMAHPGGLIWVGDLEIGNGVGQEYVGSYFGMTRGEVFGKIRAAIAKRVNPAIAEVDGLIRGARKSSQDA